MPYRNSRICPPDPASNNNAFERLPEEIIVQILQQTNPNCFASLIILNRRWRQVSSQAYLYKHQLLRCPSYSAAHLVFSDAEPSDIKLPRLRKLFAREIKRNLFESYLRPERTIISLVTNPNSELFASTRETFKYSLSPQGHYILAYSSCRILILDATSQEITVKRGLKIPQRPASVTITDDGCTLAVFYIDLQVDLYDLTKQKPRHIHAIVLDHTPRTIALSPNGSVLAAAYDSGIEVFSLTQNNLNTDRRSVKCYTVDSLTFSRDGTQILGTTVHSQSPSTVVLNPPYFGTGTTLPEDGVSAMWTTSILFPNGSHDCSHAVLIPSSSDEEANWIFTYDRAFETFRAVRIDDLRNGTTYFTGPVQNSTCDSKLLPSSLPAANKAGDLIASSFHGFIWLYGIPGNLDTLTNCDNSFIQRSGCVIPNQKSNFLNNTSPSLTRSTSKQFEETGGVSQWQLLCDKTRNKFIEGRNISFFENVSELAWVNSSNIIGDRLIALASDTGKNTVTDEATDRIPIGKGQIMILDFNHTSVNGKENYLTIEVELNDIESLEKHDQNSDVEASRNLTRNLEQHRQSHNYPVQRKSMAPLTSSTHRNTSENLISQQADSTSVEVSFDAPYSHNSPRSGSTLLRAATAVAINRRLTSQAISGNHNIEFRRTDGLEEYPHESDADEWVPPPPPYTLKSHAKIPEHIQRSFQVINPGKTQQITTYHAINPESESSSNKGTFLNSQDERSKNTDELVGDNFLNLKTCHDEDMQIQMADATLNDRYDDRYDVSPAGTPPESPQLDLASKISYEVLQEDFSNENGASTSSNLFTVSQISATSQQPSSPSEQSPQYINSLDHLIGETVTDLEKSLDTSLIENFPISQTQHGKFRSQDRSRNEFTTEPNSLQSAPYRAENRLGRLLTGFPSYNKLFSIPKDFRDQRPGIQRRRTVPASFGSFTVETDDYQQSNGYSEFSVMSKKVLNSDNMPTRRQRSTLEQGSFLTSSIISQGNLNENLDSASSSLSVTSYPASTKAKDIPNHLFHNLRTTKPEPHSKIKTYEKMHHDSSTKFSKNSVSKIKDKIRRKSLFENREVKNNSPNLEAHDNLRETEINIDEDCCSIREWETKQKKCAMM
ncbi:putative f-box domain-containing protein [Golovinomyces cichoracearum]|uniref:Putative f-box domain-containing protein n=1 Tax=Golovinomyces cichoracearum TaxID=62708 RepID=A0A420J2M4_9PEZI|nr:putative f-box domain-containing protein [Golovinomyces cichoracearum]